MKSFLAAGVIGAVVVGGGVAASADGLVGEALRFLLDLRLEEGPLGEDEATRRLKTWWAERA